MTAGLTLNKEVQRKFIHLAMAVIPFAYYYGLSKDIVIFICAFLSAGFLAADILRMNFALARKYFLRIFSVLLRADEKKQTLTGATFLFLGMLAAVILFPKEAAVPALLIVCLADPAAALAGKRFGGRIIFGKTLQGAFGFFVTASVIILFFTNYAWSGLAVALLTAVLEFLPVPLNDNLTIPIAAGFLLMLLG